MLTKFRLLPNIVKYNPKDYLLFQGYKFLRKFSRNFPSEKVKSFPSSKHVNVKNMLRLKNKKEDIVKKDPKMKILLFCFTVIFAHFVTFALKTTEVNCQFMLHVKGCCGCKLSTSPSGYKSPAG